MRRLHARNRNLTGSPAGQLPKLGPAAARAVRNKSPLGCSHPVYSILLWKSKLTHSQIENLIRNGVLTVSEHLCTKYFPSPRGKENLPFTGKDGR